MSRCADFRNIGRDIEPTDDCCYWRPPCPLAGYTFTEANGTVEVVLAITADAPGVLTFEALRLRFRVNGREREQRFPFGGRICFESPKPQDCDPPA